MSLHGGVGSPCPVVGLSWEIETQFDRSLRTTKSSLHFRNLAGGASDKSDLCQGAPITGGSYADWRHRTRCMLARLACRMTADDSAALRFNDRIPAGYTYLGQLLAHDMVFSETSLATARVEVDTLRDRRIERLLLETVYGGGPEASPLAYALEQYVTIPQHRLKLGRAQTDGHGALRDLGRLITEGTNDADYATISATKRRTVMIADARNDDNLIVSQLLVLFHIAHNVLCHEIAKRSEAMGDGAPNGLTQNMKPRIFRLARKLMTRFWRRMIVEDYLAQILHPKVHQLYAEGSTPWRCRLDTPDDDRMPVEFSHGVFRMGHAMVRDSYDLGLASGKEETLTDLLNLTSSGTKLDFPLVASWLIRWSRFFQFPEVDGVVPSAPQLSRRITPSVVQELTHQHEPSDSYSRGLPYRDLVSAVEIGTRSADSLGRQMAEAFGDRALASPGVDADGHGLKDAIACWLTQGDYFEPEQVTILAKDPPLPFFVLFEAEQEAAGAHLGFIGSVIVAEAVAGALASTQHYLEETDLSRHWEAELGLGDLTTIPALCLFLHEHAGGAGEYALDTHPLY